MTKPHDVGSPLAIRLKDWRAILVRVLQRVGVDRIGVLSGGVAFYAFLSVFPAIAGALMVWGLFTDMKSLGAQLQNVRDFAPQAFGLIADQMIRIATQDRHDLTLGAVVSVLLALWSASGGVSALMQAMNQAYHEDEKRSFIRVNLMALGFTLAGIVFAAISLAVVAAVPPILEAVLAGSFGQALARTLRWLMLIALFMAACAMIYRFAPSRAHARWRWIVPGAAVASLLWLIASVGFSFYLANFNAYNATFGSLGAVAALLMWFWLTSYVICLGAELNSQLELFTTRDTTIDSPSPRGQRGAYVADHVENPAKPPEVKNSSERERLGASGLGPAETPPRKV